MRFSMERMPEHLDRENGVCVGDVYPAKGGRGTTRFFIVVSVVGNMAHCLGVDLDGNVVSTTSYGTHVFEGRRLVGRAREVETLITIDWEQF